MKRNLLSLGLLVFSLSVTAQVCHVDQGGVFYVGQQTLVYNGGGIQSRDTGKYDIHGNVMINGSGSDALKTLNSSNGAKTDGGNFILRLNNPGSLVTDNTSYGQLFITGLTQGNITGIVDKEYRTPANGSGNYFQQVALPFSGKALSSLSSELNKTFGTTRWTQNEILKYDNTNSISVHYTSLATATSDPTGYYMLGSNANNLNTSNPVGMVANAPVAVGTVYTLKGVPYADNISVTLTGGGSGANFGVNGTGTNSYGEYYSTYIQDKFDYPSGPWKNNYGKNIYQFGNPFLTNIDLSRIGYDEPSTPNDGNYIRSIQGIRFDPGVIQTLPNGSTYSTGAKIITYSSGIPTGDVTGAIIKPMQTFVIKLTAAANTEVDPYNKLSFNTLRRFASTVRAEGTGYSVTANRGALGTTVKQLGIKGLDANGNEIASAYYVVYPQAVSGHPKNVVTTQATNSSTNLIGTFEEDKVNGGYDTNYTGSYWLYINEANEIDFKGKAIPFNIYGSLVKSLKFEILENASPISNGVHALSTGIGFYYKAKDGQITEIKQNQIIPVSATQYSLYYGKENAVLATGTTVKPSRTMVVFNPAVDNYVVQFDPEWKKADIKVYDMSGKLVLTKNGVSTASDYTIELSKFNYGYVVTVVSEKGETVNTKIIR